MLKNLRSFCGVFLVYDIVCKSLFSVGAVLLTTESWMSWFCILNVRTNEGCVDHIQWQIVPIHFFYIPLWVSFVNLQYKTIISIFYNLQLQCMQYIMSVILTFFLICVDMVVKLVVKLLALLFDIVEYLVCRIAYSKFSIWLEYDL